MNKILFLVFTLFVTSLCMGVTKEDTASSVALKIGVVNFSYCIENSKLGRQERANFDGLKKQIETTMEAKEKELNELAPKFSEEYLDTLTPEAEAELKQKFKRLSQEFSQQQGQYYQMLQQAQVQIVQKMHDAVSRASKKVSQERGITCTLNEEACFFFDPSFDISKEVVLELDSMLDQGIFSAQNKEKEALAGK